jgi:hypothetical protein
LRSLATPTIKLVDQQEEVELEQYDSLEFEQGKEIDLSKDPTARNHNLQEVEPEPAFWIEVPPRGSL